MIEFGVLLVWVGAIAFTSDLVLGTALFICYVIPGPFGYLIVLCWGFGKKEWRPLAVSLAAGFLPAIAVLLKWGAIFLLRS